MSIRRYIAIVESEMLVEMVVRYQTVGGNTVIAHRGNVWVFNTDDRGRKVLADIKKLTGAQGSDLEDVVERIRDTRPDIILGTIHDGKLYLDSMHSMAHSQTNPQVRKLMQTLGIHQVGVIGRNKEGDDTEEEFDVEELTGDIPDIVYHGTSTTHIYEILRVGLRPNTKTNWPEVGKFTDRVFLTSSLDNALFHANHQTVPSRFKRNRTSGRPIILKVRIPDRALIVPDYDVVANFHGKGDPMTAQSGYEKHISKVTPQVDTKRIRKYSPGTDWTRATGVFAYKGRIPPSFIVGMYVPGMMADTDDDRGLDVEEMFEVSPDDFHDALDAVDNFGFYDPHYRPEDE